MTDSSNSMFECRTTILIVRTC